jgi:hypothetical protein
MSANLIRHKRQYAELAKRISSMDLDNLNATLDEIYIASEQREARRVARRAARTSTASLINGALRAHSADEQTATQDKKQDD